MMRARNVPKAQAPDITGCLLLEKSANLLDLGAATGGIVQQVAELAAVRLDVDGALGGPGIALEDQDLVLGATLLLDGVHRARLSSRQPDCRAVRALIWVSSTTGSRRRGREDVGIAVWIWGGGNGEQCGEGGWR